MKKLENLKLIKIIKNDLMPQDLNYITSIDYDENGNYMIERIKKEIINEKQIMILEKVIAPKNLKNQMIIKNILNIYI